MATEPIFIGHRGARFEAPENTLPGFRYAIGIGIQALEFDVHLTADEHLAIIHDNTVDRTTNGTGKVADLTMAEIQALDARSIFPDWPEPCFVPTLDQVLDTVSSVPDLFIEIKRDIPERIAIVVPKVIEAVETRNLTSQVTMTSFDPNIIRLMKELRPNIRRGYIGNWDDPAMLATGEELGIVEADARMPEADPAIVADAKSRGWRIGMWPCNSQEALEMALSFDPDLICTDEPTKTWERYAKLRGSAV